MHRVNWVAVTGTCGRMLGGCLAGILLLTIGCLEHYGRMDPSTEVDRLFEAAKVLPDYNYYYAGGQNNPRALLGIHRAYTQTNASWTPMKGLNPEILKKRVAAMTNEIGHAPETYGGAIFSPDGAQMGIWYSRSRDVIIRFGENREVSVSLPRWPDENKERRSPFSVP
ncbi:MAG: hypothetical protein [Olavius algarvensis Delta 4 endosymbiont]|nr:MAG: hypothetical protein [Olavius algarvensis Delta 4 endosymbiont]